MTTWFSYNANLDLWSLVDASSSNGTFIGPLRLEPNQPRRLESDDLLLRFGDVSVRYLRRRALRELISRTARP